MLGDLECSHALLVKHHFFHCFVLYIWIEQPPIQYYYNFMCTSICLAPLEVGAEEHFTLLALQVPFTIELIHLLAYLY